MYVERLLQINIATLACLAAMLLGMGQRSTLMPLGMLAAAVVSVWITDMKGWFRLNKRVADWTALAALAVCLPGAMRLERIALMSAVANFVVLLQAIQLFRAKDAAVYWQVMRLSVLQVVVAALLTQEVLFGLLLVAYLFTALGAMSLLFFYSEWSRHYSRRPAGQEAAFWSEPIGRAPLGREFFTRLLRIGVAALAVGVLVFAAVPRVGSGAWRGLGGMARSTVGFSGRMRLGELGKIIQNPQEVMRVRLFDNKTDEPYKVNDGIYLRGAVLTDYRRGEWRPSAGVLQFQSFDWFPSEQVVRDAPVRQEIQIEPLDRDELFCVWPFTFLHADRRIAYYAWVQRLTRLPDFRRDRFTYELGATAFHNQQQVPVAPNEEMIDTASLLQMPVENGQSTVPGLIALAQQWVSESSLAASDRHGRALLLERRLRDSGRFTYSLQGQIRDSSLDHVEDFITKNPRGHCEYFATALCLMLRSQGIPSRVVIGYHATDFNELDGHFLVRQLDAHSWVEAFLPPSSIPDDVVRNQPSWRWITGGWLRLDATPSSRESSPSPSLLARIGKLFDRLSFAWSTYVMDMDRPRQRHAIYQPIADAVRSAWRRLSDPEWWRGLLRRATAALRIDRWWNAEANWVSWQNVEAALAILALALAAAWGVRFAARRWLRPLWISRAKDRRADRARVEFYRRFEAILARRGLVRRPSQTQREFALSAAAPIALWTGDPHATVAQDVVEAFYLVRFGGAALDEHRAQAVEQALAKIVRSDDRAVRGT